MLCIRSGVSCTGASWESGFDSGIDIPGMDDDVGFATSVGPEVTGCTSLDIGFIGADCLVERER
jgi:hypothetical protein